MKKKLFVLLIFMLQMNAGYTQTGTNSNAVDKFTHQTGEYLDVDGAKIYYEQLGNPDKPALLFLHGGFGSMEDFNSILHFFVNDYSITGIDSRGHGKSTMGTIPLTYERLQLDIEAVVNHLKINNITIIGFSDGGIVGYRLAADGKIPVRKLVTIGSTWSLEDAELMEKLAVDFTSENLAKYFKSSYQKLNPEPDFDSFTTSVIKMWTDKTANGYPCASVSGIKIPTLIVRGNDDDMFPLESAVELSKRIKTSFLLNIPFASHKAFKEYPLIFEAITLQFLQREF